MQNAAPHPPYRPDIDGLRAIAVLAVVIFHADPQWLPGGFVGVDIFFVISGYLISSIILNDLRTGTFSFAAFYGKRVRRIFPGLVTVLLACWAAGWYALTADEFRSLGTEIVAGAAFVANFHFWQASDYFGSAAELQPLLHLWSLGVEEQFYLLWPVALLLSRKRPATIIPLTVALILISFGLNIWRVGGHQVEAFFLPHTRLWELLVGAFLAALQLRGKIGRRWSNARAWAGIVLLATALAYTDRTVAFPGWWALLPTLGAALLISAGSAALVNRHVLSRPPLVAVGLISYPLYLWHWPLFAFARNVQNGDPAALIKVILIVCAVVLAWATYRFIEQPIRSGRFPRKRSVQVLSGSAAAALALGLGTVQAGGFASRFPEVVRNLANYSYPQFETEYRVGTCFLKPEQPPSEFHADCNGGGDLSHGVFLWGDSHAAHLYPGLRKLSNEKHFPLAQFNAASCPPILGFHSAGRPNCADINAFGMAEIQRLKPRVVVISAHWPKYDASPDMANLEATIEKLRASGAQRVVLVGPVPNWRPSLPKLLLEAYEEDPTHHVPTRLQTDLNASIAKIDARLRQRAANAGIEYFSPFDQLCDSAGCLTRLGDRQEDLVTWDYGHLTSAGSSLLATSILASHR